MQFAAYYLAAILISAGVIAAYRPAVSLKCL